jgi:BTB/POZ domain
VIDSVTDSACYAQLRILSTSPAYLKAFPVIYNFGLLNSAGNVDAKTETIEVLSSELVTVTGTQVELFTKSRLLANKSRFLVNDALTVVCQVSKQTSQLITKPFTKDSFQINLEGRNIETPPGAINHMLKLLQAELFTDIKIITADKKSIRAHKCILARSPVFFAMFSNENFVENKSGEVHVNNIGYHVMMALLGYLYTDKVNDLEPIAGDLMAVADFYDLPELRATCLKSLEDNVNFDNFCSSLQIAVTFNIEKLRDIVLHFIVT